MYRWRTLRNAIRNANCTTQWIIEILNAHCAATVNVAACLVECRFQTLHTPILYKHSIRLVLNRLVGMCGVRFRHLANLWESVVEYLYIYTCNSVYVYYYYTIVSWNLLFWLNKGSFQWLTFVTSGNHVVNASWYPSTLVAYSSISHLWNVIAVYSQNNRYLSLLYAHMYMYVFGLICKYMHVINNFHRTDLGSGKTTRWI